MRQDGSLWEGRSFPDMNAAYIPEMIMDHKGAEIKVGSLIKSRLPKHVEE